MILRDSGKLRLVYKSPGSGQSTGGVDIVVIPAVWQDHKPGRDKTGSACSWTKALASFTIGITRVYIFEYRLDVDGTSLWEQLLGQCYPLIQGLDESRPSKSDQVRPVLFVCHSLGGLIAKKALTLRSGSRSRPSYADVLAGIVFLGTPHLTSSDADGWNNLKLLMRANSKDISKNNLTENEMDYLISTCRQFESLRLLKPILSVYEQRKTRFTNRRFKGFRGKHDPSEVFVEETMVQFNGPLESLHKVDKTHLDLCDVEETDAFYGPLSEYLGNIARYATQNVLEIFGPEDVPEFVNLNLRTKQSVSSFTASLASASHNGHKENSLHQHPHSPTSEVDDHNESDQLHIPYTVNDSNFEQEAKNFVQLPFTHLASISRNTRFFGRVDVIDAIDLAFKVESNATEPTAEASENVGSAVPNLYVLCGMAGIGKTEIAIAYVYSRMRHFDAIFWVYADTTEKLGTQFLVIAKELGLGAANETMDEVEARDLVKAWLASPVGRRTEKGKFQEIHAKWLMVLDNADDPNILYDWLPDQGTGCILVTSKYPCIKEDTYRLEQGFDVEPFPSEVGGDMLMKLSGREKESESVKVSDRIVKSLGGLPFAIAQMSGVIRQNHLTLKEFEEWYDEDSKHLHEQKVAPGSSSYQHTIATAWTIEKLGVHALALLQVLSLLDPDRIPEEMLSDGAKKVKLKNYPVKKRDFINAKAELIHISLASRNMATNELRVHRLVQSVVRERMSEEETIAAFSAVSELICSVWPWVSGTDPTRNQPWRVPIAERLEAHILNLEKLFGTDILEGEFDGNATAGSLLSSYAWYAFERGHSDKTQTFARLARKVLEKALADKTGDEKEVAHWLGEAAHNLSLAGVMIGSSDGIEDVNCWLKILHSQLAKYDLPADHIALATAHNQMGICLFTKDEMEEAANSFQKSLDAYQAAPKRPNFSGTFPALSLSLIRCMQERADEAEIVIKPMVEEHERILGADDTTSAESGHLCRRMGTICEVRKQYEEALEYHERALNNMQETLGEKHYFTGDCYYSIAVNSLRVGDADRARRNLDFAIDAFTSALHREAQAARAMWKKASLLRDLGNVSESEALFQKAAELRHAVTSDNRTSVTDFTDEEWNSIIVYWSR